MQTKVGVVTGAAGDIGRTVCEELGRRGAAVLVVDRHKEAAERVAESVTAAGGLGIAFVADVANEADVLAYATAAREQWGLADFFFNNAGIEGAEQPLLNYPVEDWDRVMAVNLRGVFLGIKAMSHLLQHSEAPRIVNTASVAGMQATPMISAYGASKHAVIGLTKTAAVELAPLNISVNALCPGPVASAMMQRIEAGVAPAAPEAVRANYERLIPAGRYANLAEVANLATYLLLDAPMYLTGQAIALDGGMTVA